MANLTIDDAIAEVRQELDDTSTTAPRWSAANITTKLKMGLSACLTRYAREGGDRFDIESSAFTTSASTGAADLISVVPLVVKHVSVVVGDTAYQLPAKSRMRRGFADLVARDLRIVYVREYAISDTTTHPLVGVSATAANSWPAFDRWVCLETAVMLAPKDMEAPRIAVLKERRDEAAKAALERPSTPSGYPMPRPGYNPAYYDLHWQFVPSSTAPSIYLTRERW